MCRAVTDDPATELVAAVDPHRAGVDLRQASGVDSRLQIGASPNDMKAAGVQVAVDFTPVDAALKHLEWCAQNGVHAVVGTTGFGDDQMATIENLFRDGPANCLVASNFAIGAVLMMRFAAAAAPWFETAEIVESHHDEKTDAPSGTALRTAERMAAASSDWNDDPTKREVVEGARGGEGPGGIRIHSVRLKGLVAHQEVVLGTTGQSLTIRHDSYDRTSFMPGVLLAVRAVADLRGLTIGIDSLLTES